MVTSFTLHCFISGRSMASVAIEFGLYILFSGIFSVPKTENVGSLIVGLSTCHFAGVAAA